MLIYRIIDESEMMSITIHVGKLYLQYHATFIRSILVNFEVRQVSLRFIQDGLLELVKNNYGFMYIKLQLSSWRN